MAGDVFTTTVSEGLDTVLSSARIQREFPPDVMIKLVDRQTLEAGIGISWREFLAAKLSAQNYGETDVIDNPQDIAGSVLSATPQLVAIQTFIGKRVEERLNRKAYATFGELAQNGINRKKDQDGLALFATFSSTIAGTGQTLASGHIMAAVRRIKSNTSEPGPDPIHVVLHGYQIYDLQSQILTSIGTYPVPDGYTEETYKRGWIGDIVGAHVWEDGLITINATPDARGAIFSEKAVVHVQGISPWTEMLARPMKGYGGTDVWLKDEYVYVERSPGNWAFGVLSQASAPTS